MPLPPDLVRTVGFIKPRTDDLPNGTCFLVRLASDTVPDFWHGYVVTAAHCVPPMQADYDVWMTTTEGQLVKENQIPQWWRNETWDIAIAPWYEQVDERNWMAPRLDIDTYHVKGLWPIYGDTVYHVGLLRPVKSMAEKGLPMVRTGNVGYLGAPDVQYGKAANPRVLPLAQIIDTRSYSAFSGSPCWVEKQYPGAFEDEADKPNYWKQAMGHEPEWVGAPYSFCGLWGMLVGYTVNEPHGVGVLTPIEKIEEAIQLTDDLQALRREDEARELERRDREGGGIDAVSAEATETGYQRQDFLADLRAVTRRTDTEQSDPEASGTEA